MDEPVYGSIKKSNVIFCCFIFRRKHRLLAYFLLLAALIMLAPLSMYKRRVYLLVALSMIWIVMGYRGFTVGNDTSTYVQLYPQLARQDLTNGFF